MPLGVLAALKRGTWIDYLASTGAILGISVPVFVWGILLLLVFSLDWPIFPSSGGGQHAAGDAASTGSALDRDRASADRAGLADQPGQRAPGACPTTTFGRRAPRASPSWRSSRTHVLRNALIPILTVIGLNVGTLLSGAVIAETVFTARASGGLALEAILARDYPVIQGVVIVSVVAVVLINLLVDLLYGVVDPRVRA